MELLLHRPMRYLLKALIITLSAQGRYFKRRCTTYIERIPVSTSVRKTTAYTGPLFETAKLSACAVLSLKHHTVLLSYYVSKEEPFPAGRGSKLGPFLCDADHYC